MIMVTFTKLFVIRNRRQQTFNCYPVKLPEFSHPKDAFSPLLHLSLTEKEKKRLFRKLMQSRKRAKANLPTQWLQWPK